MKMFSNRTGGFLPALIFAVLFAIGNIGLRAQAQMGYYDNITYQTFYDELSPYGQWVHDPQYGYVWIPNVGRDFRPYYTNGYWAMTEYGNMWMSGYNWGWAPFHYGRWAMSNYYGWIWIPGYEWGPAWVSWRHGGGYYGWAPMGPGVSINISFGAGYNVPHAWWTFIPKVNLYSRSFHRYYAPRRTVNIINNTTIINNTYVDSRSRNTYVTGPRRSEVETATRRKVPVYNVNNRTSAGAANVSGRNVSVYRPSVNRNQGQNVAPRQAQRLERSVINAPNSRGAVQNNATPAVRSSRQTDANAPQVQQRQTTSGQVQQSARQQQNQPEVQRNLQQQQNRQAVQQRNQQVEQQRIQQQQRVQQQEQQRIQQQQQQQRVQQQQQQRVQQQQQQRIQQQQQQQRSQQRVQQPSTRQAEIQRSSQPQQSRSVQPATGNNSNNRRQR